MEMQALEYTREVETATAPVFEKLQRQYSNDHWRTLAPYIYEINRLKAEKMPLFWRIII